MIRRTLDGAFLNEVANDPAVRPWVGAADAERIDLTRICADPANHAFVTDHGGFILHRQEPGLYEVHTLFLPSGRGAHAKAAAKEMLQRMFVETDCVEIQTKLPANNPAAAGLARMCDFEDRFTRKAVWPTSSGRCDVTFAALPIQRWALRSDAALAAGREFHDMLETAKEAHGSAREVHPDDDAHDHAAGAAALMARAGQGPKAAAFYNRWARLAGYQPIVLISERPVVVDVVDAVLCWRGDTVEVLQCR
jgi:hypothetical protein